MSTTLPNPAMFREEGRHASCCAVPTLFRAEVSVDLLSEPVDTQPNAGPWPTIALDEWGNPHVAYTVTGTLYYASHAGGLWTTEQVDPTSANNTSASALAIDASGNPHIAYVAYRAGSHTV